MRSIASRSAKTQSAVLLVSTVAAVCVAAAAAAQAKLSVIKTWPLQGGGGWDYMTLDTAAPRLFVSRATHVDVLNTDTGVLLGTIANTDGVHGIALAQDLKRGFTSNGRGDSMTVFDLDTLAPIKVAPVPGHNPDAILYEPTGKHVFTFNGKSKDVTVFDAQTLALVKILPVPDKPEFAVDDGAGKIYVNIESEPGQMVVIDSHELKILSTWTLAGCNAPTGLALDRANHRLFSVCDDHLMLVTDASTGRQIAQVRIGEGPDAAAYDAKRSLVYSSNSDGTLTVIHQDSADRYTVLQNVPTKKGARTMALDPVSGKAYSITADMSPVPAATAAQPHPRAAPVDGTVAVLVIDAR